MKLFAKRSIPIIPILCNHKLQQPYCHIKKILKLLIVLFWLTTVLLLIYRYTTVLKPESNTQYLSNAHELLPESKQRWMGIYMNGQKIGFVSSRFRKEIEGYSVHEEFKMRLKVLDTLQDVSTKTSILLSPGLNIRSFIFTLDGVQDIAVEGKIHNKILTVDINTENNKSRREILLDEVPQMSPALIPYILKKGLKTGGKIEIPMFDPVTLSMQKMVIEIAGKERIIIDNKEVEAFKITGNLKGLQLLMWIDEHGNELREESPLGFTLIAEPREKAVRMLSASPDEMTDFITYTSVPFNLELPDNVSYLRVRIKGADFDGLELNSGRQTLKGNVLEIIKEDIDKQAYKTIPHTDMERFLEETPFIQSKNREIVNLANKIIGQENDPLNMGRLLWAWIFENIEKTPSITIPSAVDVLRTKKGDCNEHTVLFTALARSVGLPARINTGLVYRDKYFYYHAWPEIFAGRWIAIDPTLGQFPADAAHIKLISGDIDKQVALLKVINNISLEGLEYR